MIKKNLLALLSGICLSLANCGDNIKIKEFRPVYVDNSPNKIERGFRDIPGIEYSFSMSDSFDYSTIDISNSEWEFRRNHYELMTMNIGSYSSSEYCVLNDRKNTKIFDLACDSIADIVEVNGARIGDSKLKDYNSIIKDAYFALKINEVFRIAKKELN